MFCKNCGQSLPEESLFCSKCGTAVNHSSENQTTSNSNPFLDQQDIQNNKGIAVVAYLGILFFIPLIARPNSKYCKFHANQGLDLLIFGVALSAVEKVLRFLFKNQLFDSIWFWNFSILSGVIGLISLIGLIFIITMFIIGIRNASQGKMEELPIIGKLHILD